MLCVCSLDNLQRRVGGGGCGDLLHQVLSNTTMQLAPPGVLVTQDADQDADPSHAMMTIHAFSKGTVTRQTLQPSAPDLLGAGQMILLTKSYAHY